MDRRALLINQGSLCVYKLKSVLIQVSCVNGHRSIFSHQMFPAGLQGFMTGLDGNIPLANLLEKLPNSVCPRDENNSSTAAPGVPVTLHGIVCHEIGGTVRAIAVFCQSFDHSVLA